MGEAGPPPRPAFDAPRPGCHQHVFAAFRQSTGQLVVTYPAERSGGDATDLVNRDPLFNSDRSDNVGSGMAIDIVEG